MNIKRQTPQNRILLMGSTRQGRAATYPRGKVYGIEGIAPCILRGSAVTGSGNEPHVLIEYEQQNETTITL